MTREPRVYTADPQKLSRIAHLIHRRLAAYQIQAPEAKSSIKRDLEERVAVILGTIGESQYAIRMNSGQILTIPIEDGGKMTYNGLAVWSSDTDTPAGSF